MLFIEVLLHFNYQTVHYVCRKISIMENVVERIFRHDFVNCNLLIAIAEHREELGAILHWVRQTEHPYHTQDVIHAVKIIEVLPDLS